MIRKEIALRDISPQPKSRRLTCKRCGETFDRSGHGTPGYCGDVCREANYREYQAAYRSKTFKPLGCIECQECGESFPQNSAAHVLCSDRCRERHLARKNYSGGIQWLFDRQVERTCDLCGESFFPKQPEQKRCSTDCVRKNRSKLRIDKSFKCGNCGENFRPKASNRTKFCTRECAYEKQKSDAAVRKAAALALKEEIRRQKKAAKVERVPTIWYDLKCSECDRQFRSKTDGKPHCSEKCRLKIERRAKTPLPPFHCKECDEYVTPGVGDLRSSFCSPECSKRNRRRIDRSKRRAVIRAVQVEVVDPLAVFRRDKWRCHLCGVHTPKKLRGTLNDNAPELDHIVPLAAGGAHSYANTACACCKCNRMKGAQPRGQMRLDFAA